MGTGDTVLLYTLIIIVLLVILSALGVFLIDFFRERKYLKFQMDVSGGWEEYSFWRIELLSLYLSLLPGLSRNRARRLLHKTNKK